MKRRLIAMAALMTLVAAFPVAALAGPGGMDHQGPNFMERMIETLDLTEDQQSQIRKIHQEEREATQPLMERLKASREQIHDKVKSFPFDEAAVRKLASEQADIRTDLIVSKARTMNRTLEVLTPEQREEAERLFDRKMKCGPHRKGGMK